MNDLRFSELEVGSVDIKQVQLPVNSGDLTGGIDDDVSIEDLSSRFTIVVGGNFVDSTKADPKIVGGAG